MRPRRRGTAATLARNLGVDARLSRTRCRIRFKAGECQAARKSSDQPLITTRGRGAKFRVGPPTHFKPRGPGELIELDRDGPTVQPLTNNIFRQLKQLRPQLLRLLFSSDRALRSSPAEAFAKFFGQVIEVTASSAGQLLASVI